MGVLDLVLVHVLSANLQFSRLVNNSYISRRSKVLLQTGLLRIVPNDKPNVFNVLYKNYLPQHLFKGVLQPRRRHVPYYMLTLPTDSVLLPPSLAFASRRLPTVQHSRQNEYSKRPFAAVNFFWQIHFTGVNEFAIKLFVK